MTEPASTAPRIDPETALTWVERDYQRTAVRWVFS
jgi:hypothetical protein